MANEDRIIKSGQFTLSRIFFLAIAGAIIIGTVALGGVWLYVGYWLLTAALCVPLYLIATDYGVNMEKLQGQSQSTQAAVIDPPVQEAARVSPGETRVKRRASRPAKRRR